MATGDQDRDEPEEFTTQSGGNGARLNGSKGFLVDRLLRSAATCNSEDWTGWLTLVHRDVAQ